MQPCISQDNRLYLIIFFNYLLAVSRNYILITLEICHWRIPGKISADEMTITGVPQFIPSTDLEKMDFLLHPNKLVSSKVFYFNH